MNVQQGLCQLRISMNIAIVEILHRGMYAHDAVYLKQLPDTRHGGSLVCSRQNCGTREKEDTHHHSNRLRPRPRFLLSRASLGKPIRYTFVYLNYTSTWFMHTPQNSPDAHTKSPPDVTLG